MVVIALKTGEETCGRHVSDSKKKFYWHFRQDSIEYKLELICSFLSGKKRVLLNGEEIYNEKNILNVNFEFVHSIGVDCLRLSQNKKQFECRINNKPFADLMEDSKKWCVVGLSDPHLHSDNANTAGTVAKGHDPFAEFLCIGSKASTGENCSAYPFGQFDVNFTFEKRTPKPLPSELPKEPFVENKENQPNINNDFAEKFKLTDKALSEDCMFSTNNFRELNKHTSIMGNSCTPSDIFFEPDFSKELNVECVKEPSFLDKMGKLFARKDQPIDLL